MEKYGIQETKEVLESVGDIGVVVAKVVKSGVNPKDIPAFSTALASEFAADPSNLTDLKAAVDNIGAVPAEAKDLSMFEGLELAQVGLAQARKIVAALA